MIQPHRYSHNQKKSPDWWSDQPTLPVEKVVKQNSNGEEMMFNVESNGVEVERGVQQLVNSEFNIKQIREIVLSGWR